MRLFFQSKYGNRIPAWNALRLAFMLLVFCPLQAHSQPPPEQTQTIEMTLVNEQNSRSPLGYGNCQWLYPYDEAREKLLEEPRYKSQHPVYYAAEYGDSNDRLYTLVIDESAGTGKGYDRVYIDANNDNRVEEAEGRPFELGTTSKTVPIRLGIQNSAGGVVSAYYFDFSAFPYQDEDNPVEKIHANLRDSSYYTGVARFFGRPMRIALADLDSNGLFNDPEMKIFKGDRFFVDLSGDGSYRNSGKLRESFPYGQYTRIRDHWFSIAASPDGSRVQIREASPALGRIEATPPIIAADLRSSSQALELEFDQGADMGVEGTYRLVSIILEGKGDTGYKMTGAFADEKSTVSIAQGKTIKIPGGYPLTVRTLAKANDSDGKIVFRLSIAGSGGEIYSWRRHNPQSSKAGFVIAKTDGQVVHRDYFEYG